MKRKNSLPEKICKLLIVVVFSIGYQIATAQILINDLTPISQNFDGLAPSGTGLNWVNCSSPTTGTLPGFYMYNITSAPTTYGACNGTYINKTQEGLMSLGAIGSGERAIGFLNANGNSNTTFNYGIKLKNNTSSAVTSFTVTYTMETWFNSTSNSTSGFVFSYQTGANITDLANGTWTPVTSLDAASTTSMTSNDGNNPQNRITKETTFQIPGGLAPNSEIMLRWVDSKSDKNTAFVALDDIVITPSVTYYSKPNTNISVLTNWGMNADGSGTSPTTFNSKNQIFKLTSNVTLVSGFEFGGTNSKFDVNGFKVTLGGLDFTLSGGAAIANASSTAYIVTNGAGALKAPVANSNTEVEFPVGTTTYYAPATLKQGTSATSDNFSVRAINGLYKIYTNNIPSGAGITDKAVNKTWLIDEEISGGSLLTLTLKWVPADIINSFTNSAGRIIHYHNNAWEDIANPAAVTTGTLNSMSLSEINSFSPFGVFSGAPASLPVELVTFNAIRTNQAVTCNWKTAQELNNEYFAVERSANGRDFTEIGQVKGAGTTSQANEYSYTDKQAPDALTYYRLRQTDLDGTRTYSKVVAVGKAKNLLGLELYPNPANGLRYLKTASALNESAEVIVTNAQGQVVSQNTVPAEALRKGWALDLSGKATGIYFITLRTSTAITTLRALQQ